jgi:transcriptional regulator with XRE-family HTH domain
MARSKSNADQSPKRQFDLDPLKLRRRRMAAGLSITEMASRSGKSKGHICDLEGGRYGPSMDTVLLLVEVLGCTPSDLMTDVAA